MLGKSKTLLLGTIVGASVGGGREIIIPAAANVKKIESRVNDYDFWKFSPNLYTSARVYQNLAKDMELRMSISLLRDIFDLHFDVYCFFMLKSF